MEVKVNSEGMKTQSMILLFCYKVYLNHILQSSDKRRDHYGHIKQSCIAQFQKIPILPPQKGLEFHGGWGVLEDQKI